MWLSSFLNFPLSVTPLFRLFMHAGARVSGHDLKSVGLATHYLPSSFIPAIEKRLVQLGPRAADLSVVDRLLKELEAEAGT